MYDLHRDDPALLEGHAPPIKGWSSRFSTLACLGLVAGAPRIIGALFIVNADSDAYEYIEYATRTRDHLANGSFSTRDLAGFWFPAYQFICACICLLFNDPTYVTKLFSAVCGTASCIMVFLIATKLTGRRSLSLAAFALVALNPFHIMNSSYSMTEAPFSFLVLTSLYLVLDKRWALASLAAALAGLFRVEAWVLIPLIPALEYTAERRVSIAHVALLACPPLVCLYIYWAATGDPLRYFHTRADYIAGVIASQPDLTRFSILRLWSDMRRFLYGATPIILLGCFGPVWLARKYLFRRSLWKTGLAALRRELFPQASACVFLFAFLAFLAVAYFTNNQPQVWTRYGLIFLALGAVLAASTVARFNPGQKGKALAAAGAACAALFVIQVHDSIRYMRSMAPQRAIAQRLRAEFSQDHDLRVFSDDPATRVLSNLPADAFVTSSDLPLERDLFLSELKKKEVRFVVFASSRPSASVEMFPELGQGVSSDSFEALMHEGPDEDLTEIWLYRVN
jgi:hypothetical protein